jgi:hypothetical protein
MRIHRLLKAIAIQAGECGCERIGANWFSDEVVTHNLVSISDHRPRHGA